MSIRKSVSICLVCAWSGMVAAHHSFSMFDRNREIHITGQVSKVEWQNPHALFWVATTDADGKRVEWKVELGSPNTLIRYGLTRSILTLGDTITVDGFQARDGTYFVNGKTLHLQDGRQIQAGSVNGALQPETR